MFKIYAGSDLIYDPSTEYYLVRDPVLTMELNKAGTLEYTIPPTNPNFSAAQLLKTRIRVYNDSTVIWEGRVLSHELNYYGEKHVVCEGRLAELNDYVLSRDNVSYSYTGDAPFTDAMERIFALFNARADSWKQIALGTCDIEQFQTMDGEDYTETDNYYNIYFLSVPTATGKGIPTLWEAFQSVDEAYIQPAKTSRAAVLWNPLGAPYYAYLHPNYSENDTLTIDILQDSGDISSQTIEFGKNLLDVTQFIDASEIYTALFPTGGYVYNSGRREFALDGSHGQDIVMSESNFVESTTGIALFGRIERYIFFEGAKSADTLATLAAENIANAVIANTTITITATDLALLGVDVDALSLGDYYEVVSTPHDLDAYFQLSSIELHLQEPASNVYTFGQDKRTITEYVEQNMGDVKIWTKTYYNEITSA